jgi:hypothetical protein
MVKVVYFLGFVVLSSLSITLIVWASLRLNNANIGRELGWRYVAYGAAALVVGNLVWRIVCEFWMVLFSINHHLSDANQVVTVRHVQRVPEPQFVERRMATSDRRAPEKVRQENQFHNPKPAGVLGLS